MQIAAFVFSACQDCLVQTHPADQERPTISHLIGLAIDASTILHVTRERAAVSNPFTICTIPVTTVATVTPASNLNSELRIVITAPAVFVAACVDPTKLNEESS